MALSPSSVAAVEARADCAQLGVHLPGRRAQNQAADGIPAGSVMPLLNQTLSGFASDCTSGRGKDKQSQASADAPPCCAELCM